MSHLSVFQENLARAGVSAAIVSDHLNQLYLTGFDFDDGLVLVTDKTAYVLTDFRYAEAAKAQCSSTFEILTPAQGHLACIRGILEDAAIGEVMIEEASLSYADYLRYGEKLPSISLKKGASNLLEMQRRIKDDGELALMAKAQSITDAAFAHILKVITPNMTEIEVALELEFFMRRNGADGLAFNTIAVSGSASSLPHGVPRTCKLEKGFLTMDFGARVQGYCSDMTRTVVIGKADADMKHLYGTVLRAQLAALDAATENASCTGLDKIARDIIDANECYKGAFGHSLGHGVGLFIHEEPRLSTKASPDARLQRGNVVTFEPGIYLEGKYGCRVEDMVAIRPDGSVLNFTQSPKELIEL